MYRAFDMENAAKATVCKSLGKKKAAVCENAAVATACEKLNQGGGRFVFLEMGLGGGEYCLHRRAWCGNTAKKTTCAAKALKRNINNNVAVAWVTTQRSRNEHPCCNAGGAPDTVRVPRGTQTLTPTVWERARQINKYLDMQGA